MSPAATVLALLLAAALQPADWDPPSTTVGLPAAVRELVLPGGLLEVAPAAPADPLVLRLVEGLSGPEIAARTGLTHGSVRVNLHRGMKLLRERLGDAGEDTA